jgi:phage terminase large subunit-like protein
VNSSGSSADRFAEFAERFCGLRLEPFQTLIAGEVFTARRELLVTLPRGNGKTSLLAALGLFKLLSTEHPERSTAAPRHATRRDCCSTLRSG